MITQPRFNWNVQSVSLIQFFYPLLDLVQIEDRKSGRFNEIFQGSNVKSQRHFKKSWSDSRRDNAKKTTAWGRSVKKAVKRSDSSEKCVPTTNASCNKLTKKKPGMEFRNKSCHKKSQNRIDFVFVYLSLLTDTLTRFERSSVTQDIFSRHFKSHLFLPPTTKKRETKSWQRCKSDAFLFPKSIQLMTRLV